MAAGDLMTVLSFRNPGRNGDPRHFRRKGNIRTGLAGRASVIGIRLCLSMAQSWPMIFPAARRIAGSALGCA